MFSKLSNHYGLTPINFKSFSTKGDNADANSKSLSTAEIINIILPILNSVSDLCSRTSNFRGGQLVKGVKLQRSEINYVFKGKLIKFSARKWAYVIVDYMFKHGGKEYTSIALPLFGVSSVESWVTSDSSISKSAINAILKRLEIKPAKPEKDFQVYAGLLTEDQVAKVFREKPLEFDVDNYKAFCKKFKQEIVRTYEGNCLPMFIYDDESIHSDK